METDDLLCTLSSISPLIVFHWSHRFSVCAAKEIRFHTRPFSPWKLIKTERANIPSSLFTLDFCLYRDWFKCASCNFPLISSHISAAPRLTFSFYVPSELLSHSISGILVGPMFRPAISYQAPSSKAAPLLGEWIVPSMKILWKTSLHLVNVNQHV